MMWFGGVELGWGGFDRPKLEMLILIRIPFSFHGCLHSGSIMYTEVCRLVVGRRGQMGSGSQVLN